MMNLLRVRSGTCKKLKFGSDVGCISKHPSYHQNIIIRLFEKLILKFELFHILESLIGPDQFAYKENSNTTMALVKSSIIG